MAPRDKLGALISKMFSGGKKVVLTDKSIEVQTTDQSQISVASLSSGEKHALRILIEMLYAEQGPLLIDEPEISMHVDWQRELIPSMQSVNKNAQLILATHSPEIMAPVDEGKIFRL
jgi:predicted ATPase